MNKKILNRISFTVFKFSKNITEQFDLVLIFSPPSDIIYSQIEFYDIENFEFDVCRYKTEIRWTILGQVSQRMKAFLPNVWRTCLYD